MQPLRGILFKIASIMMFMAMASLIKATAHAVPAGEAVFFRSFFAIPVILGWLLWLGEIRTGFRTNNPMGHVWRGLVGTSSMGLGFAGLGFLPLSEVQAIGYAAPLLTVIFAAMFLNEQVRAFRLTAVALGLVGVLIVLSPRLSSEAVANDPRHTLGAMIVLSSAVLAAMAQVFVRKLVRTEQTATIVFWFSVTAATLSLATVPFGWVVPTPRDAAFLVVAGLFGGVGQILLTSSYRSAAASVIAPFEYTSMLFALVVGYVFFEEVPTRTMLGGAAIIIGAGVIIIWRERQLGLERTRQRTAMAPPPN